jgi:hypothetical protein
MLDILIREDAILSANITKVTSFIEAAKAEYTLKKYEIEESYTQYDEYDNAFIYEEADGEVGEEKEKLTTKIKAAIKKIWEAVVSFIEKVVLKVKELFVKKQVDEAIATVETKAKRNLIFRKQKVETIDLEAVEKEFKRHDDVLTKFSATIKSGGKVSKAKLEEEEEKHLDIRQKLLIGAAVTVTVAVLITQIKTFKRGWTNLMEKYKLHAKDKSKSDIEYKHHVVWDKWSDSEDIVGPEEIERFLAENTKTKVNVFTSIMNKFVGILSRFSNKKTDAIETNTNTANPTLDPTLDTTETDTSTHDSVQYDNDVSAIYNSILLEYNECAQTKSVSDFDLNIDLDIELYDAD